jgi:hypothetical protein
VSDQKARWAERAALYEERAAKAEARAAALEQMPAHARDPAFLTQPARSNHGVARERARLMNRERRAWELREAAKIYRDRAASLLALAGRNRGDAEAAKAAQREALAVSPGDLVDSIYGVRRVLKVNAKSLRLEGALGPVTIDKALCRVVRP